MGAELSKDKASQGQARAQQKHYQTNQAEPPPQLHSTPTVKQQTNQAELPPPQQSTPTVLKHQTDQAEPHPQPSTPPVKCVLSKPTSTVQMKPNDNEDKPVEITSVGNISKTTPHNLEAILKDADFPINKSEQLGQLQAGIPLNQKKMKYWVDKNSNNCFMLYSRAINICWIEDHRYWKWISLKGTNDESIEVAELLDVCWLDVSGKFDTTKLSPGTLYEVAFEIMLKDVNHGWEVLVSIKLVLPDGTKQERKLKMTIVPTRKWIKIPAGEFRTPVEQQGQIEFSIFHSGPWKSGLLVKGVSIQPKSSVSEK